MSDTDLVLPFDMFRQALLFILDEAFDHVHRAFLDPGDSLFPTLEGVSADEASKIIGGEGGNSIAGQVNHLIFYIDVAMQYMRGENPGKQDWVAAWRLVEVSDGEWADLKQQLRESQQAISALINVALPIVDDDFIGGAMAFIAHTAFHLGQIRHALSALDAGSGADLSA